MSDTPRLSENHIRLMEDQIGYARSHGLRQTLITVNECEAALAELRSSRELIASLIESVEDIHPALDYVEARIDRADYKRAKEMGGKT